MNMRVGLVEVAAAVVVMSVSMTAWRLLLRQL